MDARTFLTEWFGEAVTDDANIVVFSKPGSRSTWCASIDEAIAATEQQQGDSDVYFGVSLQNQACAVERKWKALKGTNEKAKKPSPSRTRGCYHSSMAVGGLWLDVDWASKEKKKPYPPSPDAALAVINDMPLKPSVILHTGGGFHAYWLFEEPFVIGDEKEREHVAWLAKGWQLVADFRAATTNCVLDNVSDLPRILRLPGTRNQKYGDNVIVVHEDLHTMYSPDAFEEFVPEGTRVSVPRSTQHGEGGQYILDGAARGPEDKLAMVFGMDATFRAVWERTDNQKLDSQSEYDLSIATRCLELGLTAQETINALIEHRRKHRQPEKLRQDYYAATLKRAGAGAQNQAAKERIAERITLGNPAGGETSDTRNEILHDVSVRLGMVVEIVRVVQLKGDPSQYRLEMSGGNSVTIGSATQLLRPEVVQAAITDAAGYIIPPFTRAAWAFIAQMLIRARVEEDIGADRSTKDIVLEWLDSYVGANAVAKNAEDGVRTRSPFFHDGRVFVRGPDMLSWLNSENERMNRTKLARMLRIAGCSSEFVHYTPTRTTPQSAKDVPTKTRAWVVPKTEIEVVVPDGVPEGGLQ